MEQENNTTSNSTSENTKPTPQDVQQPQSAKPKSLGDFFKISPSSTSEAEKEQTKTEEVKLLDVLATIPPTFALLTEVEKITQVIIQNKIKAIKDLDSKNEDAVKAIKVLLTLCTRAQDCPSPTKQEEINSISTIKEIRKEVVERILQRIKRKFSVKTAEQNEKITATLAPFRKGSRTAEINFCSREKVEPGAMGINLQGKIRGMEIPESVQEILFTLTQITIGTKKTQAPELTAEEYRELKKIESILENPRAPKQAIPEQTTQRLEAIENPEKSIKNSLEVIENIFKNLSITPESQSSLQRELAVFQSNLDGVGTEIDNIDSDHLDEVSAAKELEGIYNKLEAAEPLKAHKKTDTEVETKLRIFQGIREVAPALPKATTVSLTQKLFEDEQWLPSFIEHGKDAIYQARAYKGLVTLSEPESSLFGEAVEPDSYLEEGKTIADALRLVKIAENYIHSGTGSILSAISENDREEVLQYAMKVCSEEISEEEQNQTPILKTLLKIKESADNMAKAISKEVAGSETSLETLPEALKAKEAQDKVSKALAQSVHILSEPTIATTIDSLIEELKGDLSDQTLVADLDPSIENTKAIINTQEKIATLRELKEFSTGEGEKPLEEGGFEVLITILTQTSVPKFSRERALVSLCDNKTSNGTKIKTSMYKETIKDILVLILDLIEERTQVPHLASRVKRQLETLKKWKDKKIAPKTIKKTELALSICRTPENLKQTISKELQEALKSCLIANPWKNPYTITSKDIGDANILFLLAKKEYSVSSDKDILQALQALNVKMTQIQKSATNEVFGNNKSNNPELSKVVTTMRAELIAKEFRSEENNSLKELEEAAIKAILESKNPRPALEYMTAWYNSIGNEYTLQKESTKERGERFHFDPLPLVAARIQRKIGNLLEIRSYMKIVANNPEALAETYIQHRNQEIKNHSKKEVSKEPWERRIDRTLEKESAEIDRVKKELKTLSNKLDKYEDEKKLQEDYLGEESSVTEDRKDPLEREHKKLISQKERVLERHYLKYDRIAELKETCLAINQASTPQELAEALRSPKKKEVINNVSDALDQAFALATTSTKLNLPKETKKEVTPLQMLEGAAIQEAIKQIKERLKEATTILKYHSPEAEEIEVENENPQKVINKLLQIAFKTLKEIEIHLWESGKRLELSEEEEAELIKENPELIEAKKEWINALKKTKAEMNGAAKFAETQPQKKKGKSKQHKEEKKELELAEI